MVVNEKRESNFGLGPFPRCDWLPNVSGAAGWRGSRATSNNFPPHRDLKIIDQKLPIYRSENLLSMELKREDVLWCQMHRWYPIFKKYTLRTEFLKLEKAHGLKA